MRLRKQTPQTPQSNGKGFEDIFEKSARRQGWAVIRIPNGCKNGWKGKLIRVKSPFDFLLAKRGCGNLCIDTKTLFEETFKFSEIREHQVDALLAMEIEGVPAGYLVWFRPINRIIFFHASVLARAQPNTSLKPADGIDIGDAWSMKISNILTI